MPEQAKKSAIELITDKVKALFSEDTKKIELKKERTEYAEATVEETGVVLIAEAFEVGQEVYVEGEEGDVMLVPAGEYLLSNGQTITVTEEGVIEKIDGEAKSPEDEEAAKEELSDDDKPVTRKEFSTLMSSVTEMMERVATRLEEVKKAPKDAEKKEVKQTAEEKIEALKLAHVEKRKKIEQKVTKKPDGMEQFMQDEEFGARRVQYRNDTHQRVADSFKDFDFETLKEASAN